MKEAIQNLVRGDQPFCMIQKQDGEDVLFLEGEALTTERIDGIPRKRGKAPEGRRYDSISVVPFSQIRERGYRARNEGEKILVLQIARQVEIPLENLLRDLPCQGLTLEDEIESETTPQAYEELIRGIVEDEIGNGEGANFVIPRVSKGRISSFAMGKAFTIFKSLLRNDYGTYWKFIFYNGCRY
ncbi:MAG: hypothetical protein GY866_31520 [Proteobacteria bacterium]|nr:hypothetical protein [Pseudomonadota bacterium]